MMALELFTAVDCHCHTGRRAVASLWVRVICRYSLFDLSVCCRLS